MLSRRIANITPSATHAMTARIAEKRAAGENIITFSIGEPDFPTPQPIVEACEQALREGKTKYTAVSGIAALREAVCDKLRKDNGLDYTPAQICISSGAKQALSNAVFALCDEGDEVLIPTPCYVSYVEIVKLAGGVPVLVPTNDDFSLNAENFRRAITPRTKLILLNSPNNPTGAVYSRASLEALGQIAEENDLYVVSDEVYEKLVYDGAEHVSIASVSDAMKERTVVVNGFSKAFAMTGWRLGYTASNLTVSKACNAFQGHMTSCSTSFVQVAALRAFTDCGAAVEDMRRAVEERRDYMHARLNAMPGIRCQKPQGAFYLMPDVRAYLGRRDGPRTIATAEDLCNYLLDEAGVAAVFGEAFCMPGTVRFAYANSMENIRLGMDRMEAALAKLR
ncbi:MAG: pyridoxal phosphate-dependent aminotransferase [Oscillospiraceae bacterium]|nr:pyridoxal phosphate-dependent aminotransferase [Oscillospiraceae bacterium]